MSKNETPTKVIVPCRFSYLHCWEPEAINGGEPKYSVSAIIPKSDKETIKKIQAAVEAAKQESLSKWGGKIPPNLKNLPQNLKTLQTILLMMSGWKMILKPKRAFTTNPLL